MFRKSMIGWGVALLLVLNAVVIYRMAHRRGDPWAEQKREARAETTRKLSEMYRANAKYARLDGAYNYFGEVAGLVKFPAWNKKLPLAKAQADALVRLDEFLWDVRLRSFRDDADYLDGNPEDFEAYLARSNQRRTDAVHRAVFFLRLGLLTAPQTSLTVQSSVRRRQSRENSLRYDPYLREVVGLTAEQREDLNEAVAAGRKERSRLNWFNFAPPRKEQEEFDASLKAIQERTTAVYESTLNTRQDEILEKLIAGPALPIEAPKLPDGAELESRAVKFSLAELSPTFRVVGARSGDLGMTDEQGRALAELEAITRLGLVLVDLEGRDGLYLPGDPRNDRNDPRGQVRGKFLEQAEHLLLLGVLTEKQAAEVRQGLM